MDRILISDVLVEEIRVHASGGLPDEVCGLLAGTDNNVVRIIRLSNALPTPYSYAFDPKEQFEAIKEIEISGLELLGIYHSHPGSSCYPSPTDIERAFFPGGGPDRELSFPGIHYVIISLAETGFELGAFKISPGGEVLRAYIESP